MKLAVFGDSFADINDDYKSDNYWPNIVSNKLNTSKYVCYGHGGTSIDWSYMNFMNNHENFDKIIFVVTSDARFSLIDFNEESRKYNHILSLLSHRNFDDNLEWNMTTSIAKNLNEIRLLENELIKFKLIDKPHKLSHDAMIHSIRYLRDDAIIIYAFPGSRFEYGSKLNSPCMFNIQKADFYNLGLNDPENWYKLETNRYCHFTKEQNEKFAEYIIKQMNDNDFDIHDTLELESIHKFYPISYTFEQAGITKG